MNEQPIKVFVADDHPIVRQGIISLIQEDKSFLLVGQTGEGREVLPLLNEIHPEIVLLDISMPDMNGLEVVRAAKKEKIGADFIILTMYREEEYFDEAISLGVKGYLLKDNTVQDLLACLRAVSKGQHYISPGLSDLLLNRQDKIQALQTKVPKLEYLTAGERKILKLIAENKTSKEIAEILSISVKTVQNHRQNISQKLGFQGHHRLLKFALENKSLL
jgi:DNA-binding NarL/FixJ family response regulator